MCRPSGHTGRLQQVASSNTLLLHHVSERRDAIVDVFKPHRMVGTRYNGSLPREPWPGGSLDASSKRSIPSKECVYGKSLCGRE
jgi:hypothetical protein